jgi:UDPglucose 6-dehydrogenase
MIGVIGNGFVGSAVVNAFSRTQVWTVDPRNSALTIPELLELKPAGVFLCLPTPSFDDGSVNPTYVLNVLDQLPGDLLIIVKSTITPDHLINREQRIVYNPEFLTQRTAKEDFLRCDSLIFGGDYEDCKAAYKLYLEYSTVNRCPHFFTDIGTACLIKYTLNCHFAAKVTFMNEIHRLHRKMAGSTWDEFTNIMGADKRLGYTHLQVPGPDGYYGYGGACFPKDTRALLHYAKSLGVELTLLEQAIKTNELIRME